MGGDRALMVPAGSSAGATVCSAYIILYDSDLEATESFSVELTNLLPVNPSVVLGQMTTNVIITNEGISSF